MCKINFIVPIILLSWAFPPLLEAGTIPFDVDNSGVVDATDGVLILRRLNGASTIDTGVALPTGQTNSSVTTTIASLGSKLDVDQNNTVDATDGVLILRRLNGASTIDTGVALATGQTNSSVITTIDALLVNAPTTSSRSDYQYMNTLRSQAGLNVYVTNSKLEQAAVNHASYLKNNNIISHNENQSLAGFTGVTVNDRAKAAGYLGFGSVGEVISTEQNEIASIDGLMSAIYHRFGLLRNDVNEIGFGFVTGTNSSKTNFFVGNNGNSKMTDLCNGTNFTGYGTYYIVCDPKINVEASVYLAAKTHFSTLNPELVIWPPDKATNVLPVFYEESPDPLPDYSVSGYPVSAEFNSTKVKQVQLVSFKLFTSTDGLPVTNTRLLDDKSDPNKKFTSFQFALFPLERLDYNTTYRAELSYIQDGVSKNKTWSFTTLNLGTAVYNIQGKNDTLIAASGKTFHIYIPPTTTSPTIGGLTYRYSNSAITITLDYVDSNTLKITCTGSSGDQIHFTINDGRTFSVKIL
ncbi:MAG: CAP domain-containing protein [Magnetococcus sp. YQC-5]